jgi:hypothetical protein
VAIEERERRRQRQEARISAIPRYDELLRQSQTGLSRQTEEGREARQRTFPPIAPLGEAGQAQGIVTNNQATARGATRMMMMPEVAPGAWRQHYRAMSDSDEELFLYDDDFSAGSARRLGPLAAGGIIEATSPAPMEIDESPAAEEAARAGPSQINQAPPPPDLVAGYDRLGRLAAGLERILVAMIAEMERTRVVQTESPQADNAGPPTVAPQTGDEEPPAKRQRLSTQKQKSKSSCGDNNGGQEDERTPSPPTPRTPSPTPDDPFPSWEDEEARDRKSQVQKLGECARTRPFVSLTSEWRPSVPPPQVQVEPPITDRDQPSPDLRSFQGLIGEWATTDDENRHPSQDAAVYYPLRASAIQRERYVATQLGVAEPAFNENLDWSLRDAERRVEEIRLVQEVIASRVGLWARGREVLLDGVAIRQAVLLVEEEDRQWPQENPVDYMLDLEICPAPQAPPPPIHHHSDDRGLLVDIQRIMAKEAPRCWSCQRRHALHQNPTRPIVNLFQVQSLLVDLVMSSLARHECFPEYTRIALNKPVPDPLFGPRREREEADVSERSLLRYIRFPQLTRRRALSCPPSFPM